MPLSIEIFLHHGTKDIEGRVQFITPRLDFPIHESLSRVLFSEEKEEK